MAACAVVAANQPQSCRLEPRRVGHARHRLDTHRLQAGEHLRPQPVAHDRVEAEEPQRARQRRLEAHEILEEDRGAGIGQEATHGRVRIAGGQRRMQKIILSNRQAGKPRSATFGPVAGGMTIV